MSNAVQLDDVWIERILGSVRGMEYGSVNIIVHDGRIVQIERTERKRFDAFAQNRNRISSEPLKKTSQK
jgi:hypothetical protein